MRGIVRAAVACALLAGTVAVGVSQAHAASTLLSQGKTATASSTEGVSFPASAAVDGDAGTRWSSTFSDPQWIQIDLGAVSTITDVTLNPGNDAGDYPRMYAVRVSNKSEDFAAAIKSSGAGMPGTTFVHFTTPAVGRYITVRQTNATAGNPWWTIAEVLVACTD